MTDFSKLTDTAIDHAIYEIQFPREGGCAISDELMARSAKFVSDNDFCFYMVKKHKMAITHSSYGSWLVSSILQKVETIADVCVNENLNRAICETYLKIMESKND